SRGHWPHPPRGPTPGQQSSGGAKKKAKAAPTPKAPPPSGEEEAGASRHRREEARQPLLSELRELRLRNSVLSAENAQVSEMRAEVLQAVEENGALRTLVKMQTEMASQYVQAQQTGELCKEQVKRGRHWWLRFKAEELCVARETSERNEVRAKLAQEDGSRRHPI
ncbi:unnamed protein product, partial [Symbiodinium sp. CCMP2456]